jgi:hypothetical protein
MDIEVSEEPTLSDAEARTDEPGMRCGASKIACILYAEGESPPCRAMQAVGAGPLGRELEQDLIRVCSSGAFIRCPLFCRIQEQLAAHERWAEAERAAGT